MRNINSNSDIVGYRFHPTDKELVDHYLWNKILGRDSLVQAIKEVNGLFNKDPGELPRCSKIKSADQVWYFFSRRGDNKRVNRTTDKGFWKVTGKTRNVKGKKGSTGKKTLVYYEGRTPNAKWTPWVIHEYTFTSTVLDNKEGIFLCKLKNKEDEKADISSGESCQPSHVADDGIPENSKVFDPDEVLATLEEPDGRDEAENNFSLVKQLLMHEDQVPSCEESPYLYNFSGAYDRVPHLSNSYEQNDESWIRYLVNDDERDPDERSNEQVVENEGFVLPSVDMTMTCPGESSRKRGDWRKMEGIFLCKLKKKEDEKVDISSGESCQPSQVADDGIPENSKVFDPDEVLATLEEPDGRDEAENNFSLARQLLMQEDQMPSWEESPYLYDFSGAYDGVPHLSNSYGQNDESWIRYLVNDDDRYPDERSNEQVVENEGFILPSVDITMTCPGESSRKRPRFEDGVQCGVIENEEFQTTYEQVVSASSMLDENAGSKKFQAMAMVNAPNVTLTAVEHDLHRRERMLSVHNESREMDAPYVDSAVDLHCIVRVALAESLDYSFATRFPNPHYQKERSQNLIEREHDPKRITKQGKFLGKIISQDKAIDVKHVTAVNLLQKENAVMESKSKWKAAEKNNGNTSSHLNESADIVKKGFFQCVDKPSLNHKSSAPSVYFVNALVGIVLFIAVIYDLISIAISPKS